MDCKTLAEIFAGEREADLTEGESAAFDQHLNSCSECLQALASAEETLEPLTDWSAPEPSPAQWEQVTSRVQLELDRPNGRVITPWTKTPLYLAVAAAALFVAGVTLLLVNQSDANRGNTGGTAFINDDDPAPKGAVQNPKDSDGTSAEDKDAGAVVEVVDVDRTDSEVLEHAGANGYETKLVLYDGVPCVVVQKRSS